VSDDDLRAEIAALRERLAQLESRVGSPLADAASPVTPDARTRRVTRRGLLGAAVAGGAGLIATQVTSAAPAAAAPGSNLVLGAFNDGGTAITIVQASTGLNSSPFAVVNPNPNGTSIGFYSQLGDQTGTFTGEGGQRAAIIGESSDQTGVYGLSKYLPGVHGYSTTGVGVYGHSGQATGVLGTTESWYGVRGSATTGIGVLANSGSGTGLSAVSSSGVALKASGGSTGIDADGVTVGVDATATTGYGVQAAGGKAALRLVPGTKPGAPTTGDHLAGEFHVDRQGVLFFCTKAGRPGTWKKVTLTTPPAPT
jgi:hypothetical protein